MITKPKLFIIESLKFKDEKDEYFEGQIISKILKFAQIETQYYYVRTQREFEHVIGIFKKSNYRYLHISCHGNNTGISTTLDEISFKELGLILQNVIDNKRLFISACSVMNKNLANEILQITDCYSIVGPSKDIYMDDAVIFWSAFYQLMFKINPSKMNRLSLESTLRKLVYTFEIPIKYYATSENSSKGWVEIDLKN